MLEKIEGEVQNRQFRDTCNIGYKTKNKDKQHKAKT